MSTNGALGFRINKKDKIMYNHMDSYPHGLGQDVIDFIRNYSLEEMRENALRIQMVDTQTTPNKEQIEQCYHWNVGRVSKDDNPDWYSLLRGAQGNLSAYMCGLPYMKDSQGFLLNSLYCEYAYIINLDTNELEFYSGFNKKPRKNKGRYANKPRYGDKDPEYYGVVLIMKCKLGDILAASDEEISTLLQKMTKKAEGFYSRQERQMQKEKLEKTFLVF